MTPIPRHLARCARLVDNKNSWRVAGVVKCLEKDRIPLRTFSAGRVHREVEIQTLTSRSFDELYKESTDFLKKCQHMDTNEKTMRIQNIGTEWSKVLNRINSTDNQPSLTANITNDVSPASQTCNLKGVEVMSEIMTLLLDVLEDAAGEEKMPNPSLKLNVRTFNDLLNVCLGGWGLVQTTTSGVKAQNLLNRMEALCKLNPQLTALTPSTISYGAVIRAWVKTIDTPRRNGAVEARKLLEHQSKLYSSGVNTSHPNIYQYNALMHGYAVRGMIFEAESLLEGLENKSIYVESVQGERTYFSPNVLTYSSCMNCYLKVKGRLEGKSAACRAEDLLFRLYKKYEETGNKLFMPNQITFGTGMYTHFIARILLHINMCP